MSAPIKKIRHLSFNRDSATSSNIVSDDVSDVSQLKRGLANSEELDFGYIKKLEPQKNDSNSLLDDQEILASKDPTQALEKNITKLQSQSSLKISKSKVSNPSPNKSNNSLRLLQKSIALLVLSTISFILMTVVGSTIFGFSTNILLNFGLLVLSLVSFVALTNIFYIILIDRLFLFVFLFVQAGVFLLVNLFIGQLLAVSTLVLVWIVFLLLYLAYLELEKNQLSSRLFNISHICTEVTRILTTVAILVLCVGLFNQIVSMGTSDNKFDGGVKFIDKVFLSQKDTFDKLIIGYNDKGKSTGLANLFLNKGLSLHSGQLVGTKSDEQALLRDYLELNYRPTEVLLNVVEKDDLDIKCKADKLSEADCEKLIQSNKVVKLTSWRDEAYPNLKTVALETPVDVNLYRQLVKQYFINYVGELSNSEKLSKTVPENIGNKLASSSKYIVPLIFAILLFLILMLLKPIINSVCLTVTWILWSILKAFKFVKIEIETVESEVISI